MGRATTTNVPNLTSPATHNVVSIIGADDIAHFSAIVFYQQVMMYSLHLTRQLQDIVAIVTHPPTYFPTSKG